jgi:cell division protein FtsL
MTLSASQLSRSERILFGVAMIVAVLVVAVRIGAVLVASYLHHIR